MRTTWVSGTVLLALGSSAALGQELLSAVPLAGDLTDRVTGQTAEFLRDSAAYTNTGRMVAPHVPRFEKLAIATGYDWGEVDGNNPLYPVAVVGEELIAGDHWGGVWASSDGIQFEWRYTFAETPCKPLIGWATPGGALLVSVRQPDYLAPGTLYRSVDGARTLTPVLSMLVGFAVQWNYTVLDNLLFVSEYGYPGSDDNPRRIYRSDDDGQSWVVVYDEGFLPGHHMHAIVADPWHGCVYQAYAHVPEMNLRSCDGGATWENIHNFYMGVSACARSDAIYWGNDGTGGNIVVRYDTTTGRWTVPCRPWCGYENGKSIAQNAYSMHSTEAIMYAATAGYSGERGNNELWVSHDGLHWAWLRAFPYTDYGITKMVGPYAGWLHAAYTTTWEGDAHHLRFRPGRVITCQGLRIEAPVTNLLPACAASFESSLHEWVATVPLSTSAERAFCGQRSLLISNPGGSDNVFALSPALPAALPVGTVVRAQLRACGDEGVMVLHFRDTGTPRYENGPYTNFAPNDDWAYVYAEMQVTNPDNQIQLLVRCTHPAAEWPEYDYRVWIDGVQISTTLAGASWQPGGSSRAGEVVRLAVDWPDEWADFLCVRPDFDSIDADSGLRVFKAWVQDELNCVTFVFDPSDDCFKLIQTWAGGDLVAAQSMPVYFLRERPLQFVVRKSVNEIDFRVRFGATSEVEDATGDGTLLPFSPAHVLIGSGPDGDDQAPGLYLLHRTYASVLSDTLVAAHLDFHIADLDGDGTISSGDLEQLVACLKGPDLAAASTCLSDTDEDGDTDLRDFSEYQLALH